MTIQVCLLLCTMQPPDFVCNSVNPINLMSLLIHFVSLGTPTRGPVIDCGASYAMRACRARGSPVLLAYQQAQAQAIVHTCFISSAGTWIGRSMRPPPDCAWRLCECNPGETLAALDAALLQTAPAKPTSKRTRGEEAEALSRKRQREAPAWDATVAKTGGPSDRAARAAKTSAAARVGS